MVEDRFDPGRGTSKRRRVAAGIGKTGLAAAAGAAAATGLQQTGSTDAQVVSEDTPDLASTADVFDSAVRDAYIAGVVGEDGGADTIGAAVDYALDDPAIEDAIHENLSELALTNPEALVELAEPAAVETLRTAADSALDDARYAGVEASEGFGSPTEDEAFAVQTMQDVESALTEPDALASVLEYYEPIDDDEREY